MTLATIVTVMPQAQRCTAEPRTEEADIPSTPTCTPEQPEASEEDVKLPSVGSARHGNGNCLPCAWFWKPQGCLNGDACLRCHLCPAGELKRRKGEQKAKRALAKSESSPEAEPEPLPLEPELPSLGSRLHAAGQCKPCAWFWKSDGCRNGQSCGQCHLCPAGEAKARKQAKVAAIRAKGEQMDADAPSRAAPSPAAVTVPAAPMVYQVLPQYPTLLSPWRPPCPGCACCTNCVPLNQPRQCVAYLSAMSPASLPAAPCEAGERRTVQELSAPVFAVPSVTFPKLVPAPQPTPGVPPGSFTQQVPSKGSALHGDGRCSPCAWFWKPQGCHHGAECGRCHLCPATEIKLRRKAKAMAKDALKADLAANGKSDTLILD